MSVEVITAKFPMAARRFRWNGKKLAKLSPTELRVAERDISQVRAAVAIDHGEVLAAETFDADLAVLAEEIAQRPHMPPPLPLIEPNPWRGKVRVSA